MKLFVFDKDETYDVLFDYIDSHKNDVMQENYALRGIESLGRLNGTKLSVVYGLMRKISMQRKNMTKFNEDNVRTITGSSYLVRYAKKKAKSLN